MFLYLWHLQGSRSCMKILTKVFFLMHFLFAIRSATGRRPQNTMAEETWNYALRLFGSCAVWFIGMNVVSCVLPCITQGMSNHSYSYLSFTFTSTLICMHFLPRKIQLQCIFFISNVKALLQLNTQRNGGVL